MTGDGTVCPVETTTSAFDLDSAEFRDSPEAFYRRLRQTAPVYRHASGSWLLSRHRDIATALEDSRLRNVENVRCYADEVENTPIGTPTTFTRIRQVVARTLSPPMVRRFQPRVQVIVDDLLADVLATDGPVDLVDAFCHPLAAIVFCELFGVPSGDRTLFRGWVDGVTRGVDIDTGIAMSPGLSDQRDLARAQFSDYFRHLIAERRSRPTDDLLSALVAIQQDEGESFTEEDLIASCIILLIAGHESTVHFVSTSTYALLTHPSELERFREDADGVTTAIEELMRYVSPAQLALRAARTDIDIDGHEVKEGELIVLLLGAANRDPEVFSDPDRLDLGRKPNPHFAFGHGTHFCLGATLARMEGQIGLTSLARRAPRLALSGEPVFKPNVGMRGMESLPITLR